MGMPLRTRQTAKLTVTGSRRQANTSQVEVDQTGEENETCGETRSQDIAGPNAFSKAKLLSGIYDGNCRNSEDAAYEFVNSKGPIVKTGPPTADALAIYYATQTHRKRPQIYNVSYSNVKIFLRGVNIF